jgi:hypothetical protein
MKIGDNLMKKLNKIYEPSAVVNLHFRAYDIILKTDGEGNPILMFLGKLNEQGFIKGDRYSRRLLKDKEGKVVKDHWDYKGKV